MSSQLALPPTPQEQAALVLAESERLVKEIGTTLNRLQNSAEADERQALALACWERVEQLNTIVDDSAYMIGMATEMVSLMVEQRDTAVRALDEAVYQAEMNAMDEAKKDAYNTIGKNLIELFGCDRDTARFWARLLVTSYGAQFMTAETLQGLGIWMREQAGAVRHG